MAAVVEILPMTRIYGGAGEEWEQPTDSVVDVSGYTEAAIIMVVQSLEVSGGTVTVHLNTAIDNRGDHYLGLTEIGTWSANPSDYPVHQYKYLHGSTYGPSDAPGFARFLRLHAVGTNAGWHITFGVQALMKP